VFPSVESWWLKFPPPICKRTAGVGSVPYGLEPDHSAARRRSAHVKLIVAAADMGVRRA
jgi:hypothetical protein